MNQWLRNGILVFGMASFIVSNTSLAQGHAPSYDGLVQAKQLCMGMSKKVKSMIARVQSNNSSGPSVFEEAHQDEILENDTAALYALTGMGKGTFALGRSLDEAMAHYGAPDFYVYHHQVCANTAQLVQANQGARTAASLPTMGLIVPSEFDPFDYELEQVKVMASCF